MPDLAVLLEITEPEVDSSPLQKVVFKGVERVMSKEGNFVS